MKLRIHYYLCLLTAIATLYPSNAHAVGVPWVFQSVKTDRGAGKPGAVGDGIADDTAAINRTIAAGTIVYFPPGIYKYTGSLTLPANKSFRIYGDGPGVSTILFTGNPSAGIYGPTIGHGTLNVDGLTLKANSTNCGTAIYAKFGPNSDPADPNIKFHTATIHNVQIIGTTRDGTTGGYWTAGINLYKGQNSIIDKVEISGNKDVTQSGLILESASINVPDPAADAATGWQLSNLQIKWCNVALQTNGWVEGLYMTGFEFVSCGRSGLPAVYLTSTPTGKPVFQLVNGHVDSVGSGMQFDNLGFIKVSNVSFTHSSSDAVSATLLAFNGCGDVMVSECSFYGVNSGAVADENGILVNASSFVRIGGNNFTHMQPTNGSCIVVFSNSSVTRITDNLFSNVRNRYIDQAGDTYYWGNN